MGRISAEVKVDRHGDSAVRFRYEETINRSMSERANLRALKLLLTEPISKVMCALALLLSNLPPHRAYFSAIHVLGIYTYQTRSYDGYIGFCIFLRQHQLTFSQFKLNVLDLLKYKYFEW